MFGIVRITRVPGASRDSIAALVTPAAMEISSVSGRSAFRSSGSMRPKTCGLVASTITSAFSATSALVATVVMPSSVATSVRRSARGSLAITCSGVQSFACRRPRAMVVAMVPAPMKPMVPMSSLMSAS